MLLPCHDGDWGELGVGSVERRMVWGFLMMSMAPLRGMEESEGMMGSCGHDFVGVTMVEVGLPFGLMLRVSEGAEAVVVSRGNEVVMLCSLSVGRGEGRNSSIRSVSGTDSIMVMGGSEPKKSNVT
jgi:hypothetical protein